jgi:hypothetical protein
MSRYINNRMHTVFTYVKDHRYIPDNPQIIVSYLELILHNGLPSVLANGSHSAHSSNGGIISFVAIAFISGKPIHAGDTMVSYLHKTHSPWHLPIRATGTACIRIYMFQWYEQEITHVLLVYLPLFFTGRHCTMFMNHEVFADDIT